MFLGVGRGRRSGKKRSKKSDRDSQACAQNGDKGRGARRASQLYMGGWGGGGPIVVIS